MSSEMERLLDVKIGRDATLVYGAGVGENPDQVRFIGLPADKRANDLFDEVAWTISPPHAANGGVVLEDYVRLPDGSLFFTMTFHGDIQGWQRQIEEGAVALGLPSAKIVADQLVATDGRTFKLSDCAVETT